MRNSLDILLKWNDIRNSYIPPNWNNIRSISDINELGKIAGDSVEEV